MYQITLGITNDNSYVVVFQENEENGDPENEVDEEDDDVAEEEDEEDDVEGKALSMQVN